MSAALPSRVVLSTGADQLPPCICGFWLYVISGRAIARLITQRWLNDLIRRFQYKSGALAGTCASASTS